MIFLETEFCNLKRTMRKLPQAIPLCFDLPKGYLKIDYCHFKEHGKCFDLLCILGN